MYGDITKRDIPLCVYDASHMLRHANLVHHQFGCSDILKGLFFWYSVTLE